MDGRLSTRPPISPTRSRRQKRVSRAKQIAFLNHYATGMTLSDAFDASGLHRSSYYYLRENDDEFEVAFQVADNASTDLLVKEARRRAHDGIDEPTGWYKGVAGGVVRRYSDNLLMFLLKERRPEYRDKWEVTGAGGQPLQIILQAYGSQEAPKKGHKETTPEPKEKLNPDPGPGVPPIEVEAKGV